MTTTTMTIRVPTEVKEGLDALATDMRRSRSFIVAEALAAYVKYERPIVDGILRGMADFEAGRIISHEEAMARIRSKLDAMKARKAA
jgi:predicted transcriptional regulator